MGRLEVLIGCFMGVNRLFLASSHTMSSAIVKRSFSETSRARPFPVRA